MNIKIQFFLHRLLVRVWDVHANTTHIVCDRNMAFSCVMCVIIITPAIKKLSYFVPESFMSPTVWGFLYVALTHWTQGDVVILKLSLKARFMGPTWGPPGAERHMIRITPMSTSYKMAYVIAFRRKPQNIFEDESTLVQVKAWCRQATQTQTYCIARPQGVYQRHHSPRICNIKIVCRFLKKIDIR